MPLFGGICLPGRPDPVNIQRLDILPLRQIGRMMRIGIAIDREHLWTLASKLQSRKKELNQAISSYVPQAELEQFVSDSPEDSLNVESASQISTLLFKQLRIGSGEKLKLTKSGQRISSGKKQLEALKRRHPVVPLVLAYRESSKLESMIATILAAGIEEVPRETYAIHGEIVSTRTDTGRLAMRRPNLQNVPARSDLGRELRLGFVARPGLILISVDFSQIELRLLAHASQDVNMLRIFEEGGDIHTDTAMRAFNIPLNKVDPLLHRAPCKCFHPDTEVLTRHGWRKITEISLEDDVMQAEPQLDGAVQLTWTKPTYLGEQTGRNLLHLKNEGMDIRVTPDHRMLVWGDNGKPKVCLPEEIDNGGGRTWANAGVFKGGDRAVDENLLRLAIATQADGNITRDGLIRFGFKKISKTNRLRGLLIEADCSFSESYYEKSEVFSILVHVSSASRILELLNIDKTIPDWWLHLSLSNRQTIIEEAQYWDAWKGPRSYRYSSIVASNAALLQAIAAITGRKTRLVLDYGNPKKNASHQPVWNLTVRDKNDSRTGNLALTRIHDAKVVCLSVPSSYVLVRDGGVPIICGQSVNFGVGYGLGPPGLYDLMALTYATAGKDMPDFITIEWCEKFIEQWFDLYPKCKDYFELQHYRARKYGIVWTQFGRVRRIPEMMSCHDRIRQAGLRQAGNMPIQGMAADVMKLAMARVERLLQSWRDAGIYVEALLPVHDELLVECDPKWAEDIKDLIIREFELAMVDEATGELQCRCPILADGKIMSAWQK